MPDLQASRAIQHIVQSGTAGGGGVAGRRGGRGQSGRLHWHRGCAGFDPLYLPFSQLDSSPPLCDPALGLQDKPRYCMAHAFVAYSAWLSDRAAPVSRSVVPPIPKLVSFAHTRPSCAQGHSHGGRFRLTANRRTRREAHQSW